MTSSEGSLLVSDILDELIQAWEDDGGQPDKCDECDGTGKSRKEGVPCGLCGGNDSDEESDDDVPYQPSTAELIAAAGTLKVADVSDEEAIDAGQAILDAAPDHLRDDFQTCCALFLYRKILVDAVKANDTGQIYAAQSSILSLIEQT